MVCFSSRDFAGIFEPIEFLAASRNITAVSLPYLPCELSESRFADQKIRKIEVYRIEDGNTVTFDSVQTEVGETKSIRCSNILIRIVRNEE